MGPAGLITLEIFINIPGKAIFVLPCGRGRGPRSGGFLFLPASRIAAAGTGAARAARGAAAGTSAGTAAAAAGTAAAGFSRPAAGFPRPAAAGLSGGHNGVASYRDLDRRGRGGTLAPLRRALLRPMAMACLRFFTGCLPERMWCISVRTSFCALRPYLRPREREREVERCEREPLAACREERCDRELRRLEELLLLAILTSPYQTQAAAGRLARGGLAFRIGRAAAAI